MTDVAALLTARASLPDPRQPAWGLEAGHDAVQRVCEDRLATILPLLQALPCAGTLRILDLECAQGWFTLAVAHALAAHGRAAEVVGVDRSEENTRFCEALAAHHGIAARFVCGTFDTEFVHRQEAACWDAVLVLGAPDRVGAVEEELENTVSLLLAHSRVTLCELMQDRCSSEAAVAGRLLGDRLVAAHAFSRRLATFALPGDGARSLHVCSGHLAWVGNRWFAFDRVADRSHAGISDTFFGQRRFFLGTEAVVKAFRGDGRYGGVNRAELAAEAEVLQSLQGGPGRYPAILAQADDGDVVWLVREALPGKLLSEQITAGGVDRDAVACGLLAELAELESSGFHHGELRCWNCLVDGTSVRLIDFGALVRTASPLQRLALAAVLLELSGDQAGHEQPFYASVHRVGAYPHAWQPLVRYLLGSPQASFSYAEAQQILVASTGKPPNGPVRIDANPEPDDELLSAAEREVCEAFRCLRQHGEALERTIAGDERTHAARLAEVNSLRVRVGELERARQIAEQAHVEYVRSLEAELEKAQAYAASMETSTHTALDAMESARRVAVEYSDSLVEALNTSRAYVNLLEDRQMRFRRRFRWLKLLWPRHWKDQA
jgi:tRNA A-37 threonylcarbamoyl transferase component Bud32